MKELEDKWAWADIGFAEWREAVDSRLKEIYLITIDDAAVRLE
jgi:hypothetical protein